MYQILILALLAKNQHFLGGGGGCSLKDGIYGLGLRKVGGCD